MELNFWELYALCGGLGMLAAALHYRGKTMSSVIVPLLLDIVLVPLFTALFVASSGVGQVAWSVLLAVVCLLMLGLATVIPRFKRIRRQLQRNAPMSKDELVRLLVFTRHSDKTSMFTVAVQPNGTILFQPDFAGRQLSPTYLTVANDCPHCAIQEAIGSLKIDNVVALRNTYETAVQRAQQVWLGFRKAGQQMLPAEVQVIPLEAWPDRSRFCRTHYPQSL